MLSYKQMTKKFGKKHADLVRKQIIETNNEPIPPSGGWCKSCERYDCGHYLGNYGDVLANQEPPLRW